MSKAETDTLALDLESFLEEAESPNGSGKQSGKPPKPKPKAAAKKPVAKKPPAKSQPTKKNTIQETCHPSACR